MRALQKLPVFSNENMIRDETMLYSADLGFANENGGELTLSVIDRVMGDMTIQEISTAVVDTRVHMLKPGWNPAIPGWHCDGIPRDVLGQPDFTDKSIPNISHYLCVIDSYTESRTQFLNHNIGHLQTQNTSSNVWGDHSNQINNMIEKDQVRPVSVENGLIYQFDAYDYHRSIPAKSHGWRFFMRVSCSTHMRPYNEIRKQSQVYIEEKDLGW